MSVHQHSKVPLEPTLFGITIQVTFHAYQGVQVVDQREISLSGHQKRRLPQLAVSCYEFRETYTKELTTIK